MADHAPRHDRRNGSSPEDAVLESRLGQALRAEHGEQHVDVTQLLRGTRVAVRERRSRARRFTVLAAAGIAAASIPVGIQVAQWSGTSANGPVQPGGGSSQSPITPVPESAVPTQLPVAPSPPTAPESLDGAYDIPDEIAFTREDLGVRLELVDDTGQDDRVPTVAGQSCADERYQRLGVPYGGRSWHWAEDDTDRPGMDDVTLNVTAWDRAVGPRQVELLAKDSGSCRFVEETSGGLEDGLSWSGLTRGRDGAVTAHSVRWLKNDVVVAVSVVSRDGVKDATLRADRLLGIATSRAMRIPAGPLGSDDAGPAGLPGGAPASTTSPSPDPKAEAEEKKLPATP